jgi:predicted small secreted protein
MSTPRIAGARLAHAVGIVALAALSAASLSGCNTMRGLGQDIEATADAVQHQFSRTSAPADSTAEHQDKSGRS